MVKDELFKFNDVCICCGETFDKILIGDDGYCPSCELIKIEVKYK